MTMYISVERIDKKSADMVDRLGVPAKEIVGLLRQACTNIGIAVGRPIATRRSGRHEAYESGFPDTIQL